MKLGSIEGLQLYVDREIEFEEGHTEIKRILLEGDLNVGETGYFDQEGIKRNKIKKLDDDTYMFYRFDEIQTHIEEYDSDYTIEDFREEVISELDYKNLDYSFDRVELVNRLLEENKGIYDLLSSSRIIEKEQKTKSSFLSTEQRLDKQLENIANYILHPKYKNEEEQAYIEDINNYYQELNKKKGKTEQEIKEMISLKEEYDLFNHGILTRSREQRNNLRETIESDMESVESNEVIVDPSEFSKERSVITYVGKELKIDKGYWDRMGFTKEQGKFRQEIMDVYDESIGIIAKQLGIGQGNDIRERKEGELIETFEPIKYTNNHGKEVIITPSQRVNGLKRMYNELKADYYLMKEMLTTPLEFMQMTPTKTMYNYNSDTYYVNDDGEIVDVSKNTVLLSNSNTYKGLIANYYNLKDKYYDNFMDDMWYILLVFEELVKETELTNEERFVLNKIMKDYSRKEIVEEYENEFSKTISSQTIANWINRTIPNKIRNTYLDSVNEWLYTYKIKGRFKQCSKCGEIKTINNDRHFSRKSSSIDGLQSHCRNCRNSS